MGSDRMWEKYGALGGIWFVVLTVIGSLLGGPIPARDDDAEIVEWFVDNDTNIQIGAFLAGLGVIGLVWWFGSLWRAMRRADNTTSRVPIIALIGFSFSGALAYGGFAVNAATAAEIDTVGSAAPVFFSLSSVMYGFAAIGTAVKVLAVSGLAMRTGFLPRWLAQFGLLVVAAELVSSLGVASDAAFLGIFGFIAFLVWGVWILIVSVNLYQNAPAD